MVIEYTIEQQKAACIAYLASGNSVEDLCMQLITTLHKAPNEEESVKAFFQEIYTDAKNERENAPESFDTSADEEIGALVEIYNDHLYESNSPVWG